MAELVSIVMPFLDGERFMAEAVDSVLAQTHPAWELLLVDDGSSDGSPELALRFARAHPGRIRYLEHPGRANRGTSASRNLGIRHANGSSVAFLDCDDVWLPHKLASQLEVFQAHPEVDLTFGPVYVWYEWPGQVEAAKDYVYHQVGGDYDRAIVPPDLLLRHLRKYDGMPPPTTALVRRAAIERVGGYEEAFTGMFDDEVFFSKLALTGSTWVTSAYHARYRQHARSMCALAAARGEYSYDPRIPSPARGRFLAWLRDYVVHLPMGGGELAALIDAQLRAYDGRPA